MTFDGLMADVRNGPRPSALVSGASIAGPALAYWLNRCGFEVTVVEKAGTLRGGGYPVDVRGTALEVVRRMGILPRLRDVHVDTGRTTFLDEDGSVVASIAQDAVVGSVTGRDIEVRRGDLTSALYDAVRDDVEFVFDDCVETLDQTPGGVDVTFRGETAVRSTWWSARTDCIRAPGRCCSVPKKASTATWATASRDSPCPTPSDSPTRR